MTIQEARTLETGDPIVAVNGRYVQRGSVIKIRPHHRAGYWITYQWTSPSGTVRTATKRNCSVYFTHEN